MQNITAAALTALLLTGSIATAQPRPIAAGRIAGAEQTDAQRAKARGLLVGTTFAELGELTLSRQLERAVDETICGFPDSADPEIAFSEVEEVADALAIDEENAKYLRLAHRSLLSALAQRATGRGSYPVGCLPGYPDVHACTYFVDYDSYPAHFRRPITAAELQTIIDARVWGPSGDPNGRPFTRAEVEAAWGGKSILDVALDICEEANRRIGIITLEVKTGPAGEHNIHNLCRPIPGSTIGLGWFPGSTCNEHVGLHIDSGYRPDFQQLLGLMLHEFGHTLQGPHQFADQDRHQEPLSYRFGNHLCVGYSTGEPVFGLPRAPSMALWKRLYGGEPVGVPWQGKFATPPTKPPTPTPPGNGGNVAVKVGQTIRLVIGGVTVSVVVQSIDGDTPTTPTPPATLAERITAAAAAIDYPQKAKHQEALGAFYTAGSRAVAEGLMTGPAAAEAMKTLRETLLGRQLGNWSAVFAIADGAPPTAEGFGSIAAGLLGQDAALSPEIKILIDLILEFLPDGRFKRIIELVLLVIGGLGDQAATATPAVTFEPRPARVEVKKEAANAGSQKTPPACTVETLAAAAVVLPAAARPRPRQWCNTSRRRRGLLRGRGRR